MGSSVLQSQSVVWLGFAAEPNLFARLQALVPAMTALLPAVLALIAVLLAVFGVHLALSRLKTRHRGQLQLTAILFGSLLGLFLFVVMLPEEHVPTELRAQLLGLGGVLIVALSSTTFLGNAMAGILLRVVGNFQTGDWVRVEGQFGRVSERGLFHTEIATEDRDLTTLPNLYLVSKPVTVVRASGTFITADVSLGYDIGHERVKKVLKEAAKAVSVGEPPQGLEDCFVHVRELGDHSVTYRVGGQLKNDMLLSARDSLRAAMLTKLHEADIEIVSPSFMNTRGLDQGRRILPNSILELLAARAAGGASLEPETVLENVATDKATEAQEAELRGAGAVELEADRADDESRRQQAGLDGDPSAE